ncbi:MAG: hypothetical protein K9M82_10375 [Deltaproteobacteria bacterium]|nr:hypothetical protein [Deltaproteobacteria bacterium]
MRDKENIHVKVQEMVDCYATTDPLREMSGISSEKDPDEAAQKWLALATLHGINNNAKKISILQSPEGEVTVRAEYREKELPSPGPAVGASILKAVRAMTHIEEDKGKMPLIMGVRQDSVEIEVKLKKKDSGELASLRFPD